MNTNIGLYIEELRKVQKTMNNEEKFLEYVAGLLNVKDNRLAKEKNPSCHVCTMRSLSEAARNCN